ncbi:MAG: dehydrogenase [Flaviaesturariibacter sp.]|nr:dehydrogenase [Flaviaesturariibacter sp.]
MYKIIRSKSPLRIGLAGGGTDVSPYSDIYGGAILNVTINLYAYTSIEPTMDGKITLISADRNEMASFSSAEKLPIDGKLDLAKGIYNRIVKDYVKKPLSFTLTTYVDAPAGSGLGTSSSLVVSILSAFADWLNIPLGEYELAQLAYEIERNDLKMAGGKQDQYAAAFGGVNFMEFFGEGKVIVNPLRIKTEYLAELNNNIILYYTGTSRLSSKIIERQQDNVQDKNVKSLEAMHKLKEQAVMMKEAMLRGQMDKIGEILNFGWEYKKQMAKEISNEVIDNIYESALQSGASGGKISGAGGGGFMFFYCPGTSRYNVIKRLSELGGEFRRYQFVTEGAISWKF